MLTSLFNAFEVRTRKGLVVSLVDSLQSGRELRPQDILCGAWWLSGKFGAFRLEGRRVESHSSCHIGTLRKPSITVTCSASAYQLRHSTCTNAVVGSASEL